MALVLSFPHSSYNSGLGSAKSSTAYRCLFCLLNHIVVSSSIFPFLPVYTFF